MSFGGVEEVSWLKNKVDEVFYPSNENVLRDETDAYRQTFKYLLESLEVFLTDKSSLNTDANFGVFYDETLLKFVCFDIVVMNNPRRKKGSSYRLWKDEFKPQVAFEILKGKNTIESVAQLDVLKNLGMKEQYVFDPEYNHLPNGLIAFHLKDGKLQEVTVKQGRIFSPTLGLEIVDTGEGLRLYNPETEELQNEVEKLKAELAKLKEQK